jgi:shikimate dehydrogenase
MRFVLIGHPVAHSVSPAMHRAAHRALGLEASYEAVDCPDEAAAGALIERVRAGQLAGANVTIPWKRLALERADRIDPLAARTGAANVLVAAPNAVVAHNTDVGALADRFRELAPGARRFVVIGSGGAALAAVTAAADCGAEQISVTARSFRGGAERWPNAGQLGELGAQLLGWPEPGAPVWTEAIAGADVIVQATSAGMRGASPGEAVAGLVPWRELRASAAVLDLVYNPEVTPFIAAARAAGLRAESGLAMLVGQAVRSLELWTGRRAPADAMRAEALRALEAA